MVDLPRRRQRSELQTGLEAARGDTGRQEIHDELERLAQRLKALEDRRPVEAVTQVTEAVQERKERPATKKAHAHPYVRLWLATTEANLENASPPVDGEDLGWTSTDQAWWKRNAANNDWETFIGLSDATPTVLKATSTAGNALTPSRGNHGHGLDTSLSGRDDNTLAVMGNKLFIKLDGVSVCLSHLW